MGFLASIFTSITSGALSGILQPILGYFTAKQDTTLEGLKAAAGADTALGTAFLNAQVEMAQLKASQNMWFGARLIFLALGALVTIHFGAVVFDSISWNHVVGSWGIAALPKPLDSWEGSIILSFFIVAPAAPVFSAVTSWLHKR